MESFQEDCFGGELVKCKLGTFTGATKIELDERMVQEVVCLMDDYKAKNKIYEAIPNLNEDMLVKSLDEFEVITFTREVTEVKDLIKLSNPVTEYLFADDEELLGTYLKSMNTCFCLESKDLSLILAHEFIHCLQYRMYEIYDGKVVEKSVASILKDEYDLDPEKNCFTEKMAYELEGRVEKIISKYIDLEKLEMSSNENTRKCLGEFYEEGLSVNANIYKYIKYFKPYQLSSSYIDEIEGKHGSHVYDKIENDYYFNSLEESRIFDQNNFCDPVEDVLKENFDSMSLEMQDKYIDEGYLIEVDDNSLIEDNFIVI